MHLHSYLAPVGKEWILLCAYKHVKNSIQEYINIIHNSLWLIFDWLQTSPGML